MARWKSRLLRNEMKIPRIAKGKETEKKDPQHSISEKKKTLLLPSKICSHSHTNSICLVFSSSCSFSSLLFSSLSFKTR